MSSSAEERAYKARSPQEVQSFLKQRANAMIKAPTLAESRLKKRLDQEGIRYQFQSIKFARGTYRIFDFYLPKHRIVIEVDGLYHDPDYDERRDKTLVEAHRRLTMLRFKNEEIFSQMDGVIERIRRSFKKPTCLVSVCFSSNDCNENAVDCNENAVV